jgi:hypothetical protein
MARNPKAGIEVGVNDRPAVEGLRNLAKSFGAFSVQAAASLQLAQAGWRALTGTIMGVVDATSEYVQLAMEQERVERRAIAAIQTRQTLSQAELEVLQQANAARQQQLGIGDEVQLQLQGTMAAMGVAKEQLDDATRAAIGLSEAMGMGLEEAAKLSAKALTGNVAALAEVGLKVASVAEAQAQLNGLYRAAIEQSDTLQTRLSVLSANYGDLKETVGGAVTQSGALRDIIDAVSQAVVEFTTYLNSPTGKQAVDGFFRTFAVGAAMAIDSIEDMRVAAIDVVNWFKKNFTDQVVVESLSGEPSTLRKLSAKLYGIGFSALEVMAAPGAGAAMGPPAPPTPTGGGGGRRARAAERPTMHIDVGAMFGPSGEEQLAAQQLAVTREAADIQRQVDMEVLDQRNELHRQAFDLRMQTTREMSQAELQAIVEGGKAINEAQATQMQSLADVALSVTNVIGSAISELITAWASGADMAEFTVGKFAGGIIKNLGIMAVQAGVAALMLAPLALVPFLAPLTGGPQMAPVLAMAGGALTVAGAGMIALGASMGGGTAGGGSTVPRAGAAGGGGGMQPRGFDPVPRGFGGSTTDMAAAPSYTVNVSFGVVGDQRRAARMIRDVLERGR